MLLFCILLACVAGISTHITIGNDQTSWSVQHKWPCYLVLLQPPYFSQAPVIRLAHQKICIIIYCQHIGCLPFTQKLVDWQL